MSAPYNGRELAQLAEVLPTVVKAATLSQHFEDPETSRKMAGHVNDILTALTRAQLELCMTILTGMVAEHIRQVATEKGQSIEVTLGDMDLALAESIHATVARWNS